MGFRDGFSPSPIAYADMRRRRNSGSQQLLRLIALLCAAVLRSTLAASVADCKFDRLSGKDDAGFCGWRPDLDGGQIWHTGNAVIVDSANSIVKQDSCKFLPYPLIFITA